jgi:hypothetical protein
MSAYLLKGFWHAALHESLAVFIILSKTCNSKKGTQILKEKNNNNKKQINNVDWFDPSNY